MSDTNKIMNDFINAEFKVNDNEVLKLKAGSIDGIEIIDYAIAGLQADINNLNSSIKEFQIKYSEDMNQSNISTLDFLKRKLEERRNKLQILKVTRNSSTDRW